MSLEKPLGFLSAMLLLQVASYITVIFDIPVARQVLLFVYFTFLPGYLIVKLFRFSFKPLETLVFSAGFSITFLMLIGFVLNELGFMAGLSRPLSTTFLLVVLNDGILALVILNRRRNKVFNLSSFSFNLLKWIAPLLALLVLSVVGALVVGVYENNLLLLLMLLAISIVAIFLILRDDVPSVVYGFAAFIIGVSLLYHSSLFSRYICPFSSDIPGEFFVFKYTQTNGHWESIYPAYWGADLGRLNSMLSVTILPTIYSNLLNLDSTWIFKLVIPIIYALVPLGLYQLWQMCFERKHAFISAFLLMAQCTFYTEMLGLTRQMIGELFLVLLLLVITNQRMKSSDKMVCFILFSFALVVSHYSLALIFMFFISFALIALFALKRPSNKISVSMVVFFFVVMFTWYIYTSGAVTFKSILEVGDHVYSELGDFFNLAARDETILQGLGLATPPTFLNMVSRFFAYLTEALIVLGFVGLITKQVIVRMENEFFIFSLIGIAFLAMLIVVPGLAESLNMWRFYHVLLFFLAPFCVLGVEFIVKFFFKQEKKFVVSVLLLIVLIPYFLFQTNFVYEVVGSDSWSIPLSGYRMDALRLYNHYGYIDAYSVYGMKWLSESVDADNSAFYMDENSLFSVSTSYGLIVKGKHLLSNITIVVGDGFVYLNTLNVVYGVVPYGQLLWNTSELSFIFDDLSLIYSNGQCLVYQNTG